MNSDDKYEKKEYQARMEEQLAKALMAQFPVDDSSGAKDDANSDTVREVKLPETKEASNKL